MLPVLCVYHLRHRLKFMLKQSPSATRPFNYKSYMYYMNVVYVGVNSRLCVCVDEVLHTHIIINLGFRCGDYLFCEAENFPGLTFLSFTPEI